MGKKSIPKVMVIVTTYNHEKAIKRCIQSLAAQCGEFLLDALILDDKSTDGTSVEIRQALDGLKPRENIRITYRPNEKNLGMQGNLRQALTLIAEGDSEYCCVLEGDDYWIAPDRIQRHIDLLKNRPECSLSFNALLLYMQKDGYFRTQAFQETMRKETYKVQDLAQENFIGNLSAVFYRTQNIRRLPLEIFDEVFVADWLLNLIMAREMGPIGYISEPLTVYRIHDNGVWSGENLHRKNQQTLENAEFIRRRYPGELDNELDEFLRRYIQGGEVVASLYCATEQSGYSESTRLRAVAETQPNGQFYARFILPQKTKITSLRFDPAEGTRLKCCLNEVECEGEKLRVMGSNGLLNRWFFTTDPWYTLAAPQDEGTITVRWKMVPRR